MSTKHKKRRLRRLLVASMFAAVLTAWAVPAAGAHPTGVYPVAVPPVVTAQHPTVSHAFLNHATGRDVQAVVHNVSQSTGSGFGWADAGIGAAVVLMTVVLLGGAIQLARTRRTIATP
jgi:hypothetical protein